MTGNQNRILRFTLSIFGFGCVISLFFACLVFNLSQNPAALADNAAVIGAEDIPTMKEKNAQDYVSGGTGVEFEITCSLATEKLAYKFDADRNDTEGLSDILPPEGEISLTLNAQGTKLIGSLKTLYNGEIMLYAYIRKGGNDLAVAESLTYIVNKIDWSPPVLDPDRESMATENGTLNYTIYVYDNVKAHTEITAASGLKEITVFYWDEKSTVNPEDEGISDSKELIEKYGDIMGIAQTVSYPTDTKAVQYDFITFPVSHANVAYYVLTVDRVGNVGLARLFYRQAATRFPITVDGVEVDCTPFIELAEKESNEGKGKYNQELLNELSLTAYRLRITFMREGYSDTDRKDAWRELRDVQRRYSDAKREVTLEMKNADLLGGKAEIVATVDGIKKDMLLGDSLVVELMWVKYDIKTVDASVLKTTGVTADTVWKLEYSLKWNGQTVNPDNPITVHVEWGEGFREIGFAKDSGLTVERKEGLGNANWAEFTLDTPSETVWIAMRTKANLFPLWIALGVGCGALLFAVVAVVVMKKKKLFPKKGTESAESGETSALDTAEVAQSPKKKMKNKKKK